MSSTDARRGVSRRPIRTGLLLLLGGLLVPLATQGSAPAVGNGNAVVAWNEYAGKAAQSGPNGCLSPGNNPLHESHLYAVTQLAVHDAVNAIDRRSTPYAYAGHAPGASVEAAVAAAARTSMLALFAQLPEPFKGLCSEAPASVESDYAASLAAVPNGAAKSAGIAVGNAAAQAVLAARSGDGATTTTMLDFGYHEGTKPGEWRFTPGIPLAFAPGWGEVEPFGLTSAAQFRPAPPYRLASERYAREVNEVKRLGALTGSSRTPDQTQIAHFWIESSPLSWNRLGRQLATESGLDPWESARLFGLLNMALADGYIGSFHTKFDTYRFWRPIHAIRLAHTDGNPLTTRDAEWDSVVPTPPIPDYDSAHSVEGGAAASVFRLFFGSDSRSFSQCSLTVNGPTCYDASPVMRHFTSFSQAARENAVSRVYVGFHFRMAANAGLKHGAKIGRYAVENHLLPTG